MCLCSLDFTQPFYSNCFLSAQSLKSEPEIRETPSLQTAKSDSNTNFPPIGAYLGSLSGRTVGYSVHWMRCKEQSKQYIWQDIYFKTHTRQMAVLAVWTATEGGLAGITLNKGTIPKLLNTVHSLAHVHNCGVFFSSVIGLFMGVSLVLI